MSRREPQQHLKIAEFLKEEIREGRLKPGDFLPSEAELCAQFSTSRGPVRQAMASLRSTGLISSGRGRRSVVLGNFEAETFEASYSVEAFYHKYGETPTQKIQMLARCPAPADITKSLNVKEGEPIVYLQRVHAALGKNRILQEQYFPMSVGQYVLRFDENLGSLHDFLAKTGLSIDSVDRVLKVVLATPEEAELLDVEPNTPLWRTTQHLYNHNGEPVEFSTFKYVADRIEISMSMVRGSTSPLRLNLQADAV